MFRYIKQTHKCPPLADALQPWSDLGLRYINERQYLWVYGGLGCGKTVVSQDIARRAGDNIELHTDHMKSGKAVSEFLSKLPRQATILLDSPDLECQGLPVFFDIVRTRRWKVVACSVTPPSALPDWFQSMHIQGKDHRAQELGGDARDTFPKPKKILESMVCSWGKLNPMEHLGMPMEEHGSTWGILHENYVKSCTLDEVVQISDCLSQADMMDGYIYDGNWDLMPYFSAKAIIEPSLIIGHRLGQLRSGSAWTKHSHAKMKANRARELELKGLPLDTLQLFIEKAKADPSIIEGYELTSGHLDSIRHLSWKRIDVKGLKKLKKFLHPP